MTSLSSGERSYYVYGKFFPRLSDHRDYLLWLVVLSVSIVGKTLTASLAMLLDVFRDVRPVEVFLLVFL